MTTLKPRQKFGKYRIQRRIAEGGFADVYRAYDTVEGIHVAIKIPQPHLLLLRALDDFRKEVRLTAKLDHPNILPIKNAGYVGDYFVIVYPLGDKALSDRLRNRIALRTVLDFTEQMLKALAFAHRKRIIHCDIKPENFILFPGNRLRLADFGIAKLGTRTMSASGSGTVGYVAPEQAMGKPSLRSDVFSLGLLIYRMLSGKLPEWPFDWPPPGYNKLKKKVGPDFVAFLQKALEVDARHRYADATEMLAAYRRLKLNGNERRIKRRRRRKGSGNGQRDWEVVRLKEFRRHYGKQLGATFSCGKCKGPIAESMKACPWCGHQTKTFRAETRYPSHCRHCKRGMKLDWRFCQHCYTGVQGPRSDRAYSDVRYEATCSNARCRGPLMRFMRYCPWCHTKVTRKWKIEGTNQKCPGCSWGVLRDFWKFCPWCRRRLAK